MNETLIVIILYDATVKMMNIEPPLAREIISSQEYQTSKFQKTDKLIEFSVLDLAKNSPLLIDFESISLFFVE